MAPCRLHVPNPYGTEYASYEKVQDFPLNSAAAFALSMTYGKSCASSIEIEDVSHNAPCRLLVPKRLRYGMSVLPESLRFPA